MSDQFREGLPPLGISRPFFWSRPILFLLLMVALGIGFLWWLARGAGVDRVDPKAFTAAEVSKCEGKCWVRANEFGAFLVTLHNGTDRPIESVTVRIKTSKWERDYRVEVAIAPKQSQVFYANTFEPFIESESWHIAAVHGR